MHTCYSLFTNEALILDSQISITSLGSCSPKRSQGCSQLIKWARDLSWMNRGSIYTPSFKMNRYVPESAFCGVTERFGQGDRTLQSVLPAAEPLSCDRTLTCIRSALIRRIRSQKLLSGTLLMLIGRWSLESGHFAAQRPVSNRNLTSVR